MKRILAAMLFLLLALLPMKILANYEICNHTNETVYVWTQNTPLSQTIAAGQCYAMPFPAPKGDALYACMYDANAQNCMQVAPDMELNYCQLTTGSGVAMIMGQCKSFMTNSDGSRICMDGGTFKVVCRAH